MGKLHVVGSFPNIDPAILTECKQIVAQAVAIATGCAYGAKTTIDDGYVDWGPRTIVFAP